MKPSDLRKSLDELEGIEWGPPSFESRLVTTCSRLRRKPIGDYSVADLRIMISQKIGLPFLLPLALVALEKDPLVEGDCYGGDLLVAVLSAPQSFWHGDTATALRMRAIVGRATNLLPSMTAVEREAVEQAVASASPILRDGKAE